MVSLMEDLLSYRPGKKPPEVPMDSKRGWE